jgi:3-hydroxy-9,10-secoandrosta-1,3,5(10)-triene-9,17-dione monooxygenase
LSAQPTANVRDLPLDGLLERVCAIVPLIAGRARDAERARKPDDDVIAALEATGVFRSFVPQRFGGYEIDLDLFVEIGVTVSEAGPSTGWITTFYMEHNWLLHLFSDDLQQEIFGAAPYILAPGSVNPLSGQAVPTDDGYELTGHWKFATGIVHANWVVSHDERAHRFRRRSGR